MLGGSSAKSMSASPSSKRAEAGVARDNEAEADVLELVRRSGLRMPRTLGVRLHVGLTSVQTGLAGRGAETRLNIFSRQCQ